MPTDAVIYLKLYDLKNVHDQ